MIISVEAKTSATSDKSSFHGGLQSKILPYQDACMAIIAMTLLNRLIFDALKEIYVVCCCFLRFFHHWNMAAILDDYSLMIF
jgi:hypothetical protein